MTDLNDDLWPDLTEDTAAKAPFIILSEQAKKLGAKTSNIVEAEVTANPDDDGRLNVRLMLRAPALNGYEYALLSISQPVDLYPIYPSGDFPGAEVKNEQEFKQFLEKLFKSERTIKIISSLIAQSKHAA